MVGEEEVEEEKEVGANFPAAAAVAVTVAVVTAAAAVSTVVSSSSICRHGRRDAIQPLNPTNGSYTREVCYGTWSGKRGAF